MASSSWRVSTGGQAVLQIVVLSLLARAVTPADFGLVSGALIAVYLATALAESGIGQAIIQRSTLTGRHMRAGWTLSVLFGAASWGIIAALAPTIEKGLGLPGLTPILRVMALIFVINSLTLSDFLLSRRLQFARLSFAELTSYAVGYGGIAVTLAYNGFGPWAIVWGQVGQSTCRMVLVTCLAPYPYRPSFALREMGELLNFGGGLTLGRVAIWAASQMDSLVVGRYLGPAALGLYGRAFQLVQLPANLFGQVANEVLFPAMASIQDREDALRRVFRLGTAVMAALAVPCSLLAAVSSKPLVLLLLGPDWLPLRAAFDVIIFGLLFRTTSKLADALMKARGAVYRRAWRNILFAALVLVASYTGKHWGLQGVAIGVLMALAANYIITSHLCLKLVNMTWRDFVSAHQPALILASGAGIAGLASNAALLRFTAPSPIVQLLVVWGVGVCACAFMIRIAARLGPLSSLAALMASLHSLLGGVVAKALARLLGPRYALTLLAQDQLQRQVPGRGRG